MGDQAEGRNLFQPRRGRQARGDAGVFGNADFFSADGLEFLGQMAGQLELAGR